MRWFIFLSSGLDSYSYVWAPGAQNDLVRQTSFPPRMYLSKITFNAIEDFGPLFCFSYAYNYKGMEKIKSPLDDLTF
jgi:hypothetical protein